MNVPLIDLQAQYQSIRSEVNLAISRVLSKGNYVMGEEVEAFEQEWAEYCKAKYCIGVSSGTDALYLVLKAMELDKEEIITTPFTFFATVQAIIASGNYPRFIDVDGTGNLPPMDFENNIAIPVHLYGRPGEWKGRYVIEDSAQAHGLPLSGLAASFSFYPTKNLGAMGQAGAVVTNDLNLANEVRKLRTYGEMGRFVHYRLTGNHRMDELQAAILRAKLPFLGGWNWARRNIAGVYRARLEVVSDVIQLPESHSQHNYHIFAIRVKDRDNLASYLKGKGIQTSVRYPLPMHLQPALRYLGWHERHFPQAEAWAKENLSLPMYPELTAEQVRYVCEEIKEWVGSR